MNTKTKRILTPTETQGLKERVEQDTPQPETEDHFSLPVSGATLSQKKMKYVLSQGQPGSLSREEKLKKENRVKILTEWLAKRMVPRNLLGLRLEKDGSQTLQFQKTAKKMSEEEMSAGFQKIAEEYKNLQRELGRNEMANLEEIRPMN